ncbi:MAG: hypothetical protein EOO88_37040 [Pedobacter sp.]|nr:MAG: hypothetical protein EOO88_37040 [Pedobacter sp.]
MHPEMSWFTTEVEYDGLPLLLRRPDNTGLRKLLMQFPFLTSIEHVFEQVQNNGLPDPSHNETLEEFDQYMCGLFEASGAGVIFLIETFAGRRIYYYCVADPEVVYVSETEILARYGFQIQVDSDRTLAQGFIDHYPFDLGDQ